MGQAAFHVIGSLLASLAFLAFTFWVGAMEQEKTQKRRLRDASLALGVPISALESDELAPRLLQYSSERFSSELFRNRLADFCGILRTVWGWLGSFVQLAVVATVAWQMYESGAESAVFMWIAVATAVFFWTSGVLFSFACLLVTGRYPGEPKAARDSISEYMYLQDEARKVREGAARREYGLQAD